MQGAAHLLNCSVHWRTAQLPALIPWEAPQGSRVKTFSRGRASGIPRENLISQRSTAMHFQLGRYLLTQPSLNIWLNLLWNLQRSGALRFQFGFGEEINAVQFQNYFLHNFRTTAEVFCRSEAESWANPVKQMLTLFSRGDFITFIKETLPTSELHDAITSVVSKAGGCSFVFLLGHSLPKTKSQN